MPAATRSRIGGAAHAAAAALLALACGSNSLVIGGDPEQQALTGDDATSGGASGSTALGGGSSGTGGGGDLTPGVGGSLALEPDAYPWVPWAQGRGYEQVCPRDGDTWGATCWNHSESGTAACEDDGAPFCNACLCMISCVTGSDCPGGRNGAPGECLGADSGNGLCFLPCGGSDGDCPTQMACSRHPTSERSVCMWVDSGDDPDMPAPR